jgi:hypothetical protein
MAMDLKKYGREKAWRLAHKIFEAFPEDVSCLRFYILDCGCLYLQRLSPDGIPDPVIGVHREGREGPCEICLLRAVNWRQMVIDEVLVYRIALQITEH